MPSPCLYFSYDKKKYFPIIVQWKCSGMETDGYCYSFIVLRREKERSWLCYLPISASELGWVSSVCTYGHISCRRNMSVKAGMPRARLRTGSYRFREIRIMWASSFQAWVASWVGSRDEGMTEWALCVSTVSWETSCSGGMLRGSQAVQDLCYPRIADFLIWGGRGPWNPGVD